MIARCLFSACLLEREKSTNKVSYFSFVVYKAYKKDNFYGIRQFLESSFIERRTAGIDH